MTRIQIYALFLSGAIAVQCFTVSVFFYFFWKKTLDRLFAIFSIAFSVLGLERVVLTLLLAPELKTPGVYLLRLACFLTIIVAILDKNRGVPKY